MQTPRPPKIKSLSLALLLSGIAVLGSAPAAAAAAPIKLGVYVAAQGQVGAPEDAKVLDSYAAMVGRKPDIVMDYSNITDPLLTKTEIANLQTRGETPLVTWQLFQSGWGGPTIPLSDVAAGKYDSYLRQAANAAKAMPFGEIMIRFAHEMNGDWYGWSGKPTAYVEAWRHVVTIFRQENATNVKWVWSPNVDNGSYPFASYFPGDSWVDYVGLDGYNWGTTGQGVNRWQSISEVFSSSYDQLTKMSTKPVIVTETSSSETGGSKAAWIREGFLKTIPAQFPRVQAVVWFDRDQEDDWRIDSSSSSLNAYREVVASTLYGGAVPPPPAAEETVVVKELEVTPQVPPPGSTPPPTTTEPAPAPTTTPTEPAPTTTPTEEPTTAPTEATPPPPTTTTETTTTTPRSKKKRRRSQSVRIAGKVTYRLSRRASAVRLTVRGPGLGGGASKRALTITHPKRRGRVRLASLTGGSLLRDRRYRVVATAVSETGSVSKPRHARFRVTPKAHHRSHRSRA